MNPCSSRCPPAPSNRVQPPNPRARNPSSSDSNAPSGPNGWRRLKRQFVDPPPTNEKLVNYLAAGSIQGLRSLRYERRIARNRIIFICIVLGLLLWGVLVIFWHYPLTRAAPVAMPPPTGTPPPQPPPDPAPRIAARRPCVIFNPAARGDKARASSARFLDTIGRRRNPPQTHHRPRFRPPTGPAGRRRRTRPDRRRRRRRHRLRGAQRDRRRPRGAHTGPLSESCPSAPPTSSPTNSASPLHPRRAWELLRHGRLRTHGLRVRRIPGPRRAPQHRPLRHRRRRRPRRPRRPTRRLVPQEGAPESSPTSPPPSAPSSAIPTRSAAPSPDNPSADGSSWPETAGSTPATSPSSAMAPSTAATSTCVASRASPPSSCSAASGPTPPTAGPSKAGSPPIRSRTWPWIPTPPHPCSWTANSPAGSPPASASCPAPCTSSCRAPTEPVGVPRMDPAGPPSLRRRRLFDRCKISRQPLQAPIKTLIENTLETTPAPEQRTNCRNSFQTQLAPPRPRQG
jgi:hypothetical protein